MVLDVLPTFPEFVPLELGHKGLFEELYQKHPPVISDLNFTELYSWRHVYKAGLSRLRGNLCIYVEAEKLRYFYPPLGSNQILETLEEMSVWAREQKGDILIFGFTEGEAKRLEEKEARLHFEEIEIARDYVYLTRDLVDLKGNKYHKKKNLLAQFKKKNEYEFIPLTRELVPACVEFQKQWSRVKGDVPDSLLKEENVMVLDVLEHFSDLAVFGAVLRIPFQIEAFTLGGELNPDTALVHVEKANPEFKGIYQAINQMFCDSMLAGYTCFNREQDMGDAGLRKAKLSYLPHHMVKKYILKTENKSLKEEECSSVKKHGL